MAYGDASGSKLRGFYGTSSSHYGYGWLKNTSDTDTIIMNGNSGNVTATSWTTTSDERFKRRIENLSEDEAIALLDGLTPFNYTFKQDPASVVYTGLSAQEIRNILKDNNIGHRGYLTIAKNDDDRTQVYDLDADEDLVTYGIDYSKLVPTLLKGWQMHEARIKELEAIIAS